MVPVEVFFPLKPTQLEECIYTFFVYAILFGAKFSKDLKFSLVT